jgi:hypothetical protein
MNNADKGKFGEKFVADYLTDNGYSVRKRVKGEKGFDLLAQKDGEALKIEVKTSNNHKGGIPDMHDTEFSLDDGEWKFIADRLYVVRLDEDKPVQLDILTKQEVDAYSKSHRTITAIRTMQLDRDLFKKKVGKTIYL